MDMAENFVASPSVPALCNPPAAEGVPLRVLCVDDCETDVALETDALKAGGYLRLSSSAFARAMICLPHSIVSVGTS